MALSVPKQSSSTEGDSQVSRSFWIVAAGSWMILILQLSSNERITTQLPIWRDRRDDFSRPETWSHEKRGSWLKLTRPEVDAKREEVERDNTQKSAVVLRAKDNRRRSHAAV